MAATTLQQMITWISTILNSQLDDAQITYLINKAHAEEVEGETWGRMRGHAYFNSFPLTQFSTISVTQNSPTVTLATGQFPVIPQIGTSTVSQYALRVGTQQAPISVAPLAAPGTTLTLSQPYPGPTASGVNASLFQWFYSIAGFNEILSLSSQGQSVRSMTQNEIDLQDPSWATTTGVGKSAYRWIAQGIDAAGFAQISLWPIESNANAYGVWGIQSHVDLVNPTDFPQISAAMLMAKVLSEACETLFTLRGEASWANMRDFYTQRYQFEHQRALEQDARQFGIVRQVNRRMPLPATSSSPTG